MNKFTAYKVLAPFRVKKQKDLRSQRSSVTVDSFIEEVGGGSDFRRNAAQMLWQRLRETSFIEDFKPDIHDDLHEIYGLSSESIRDEVIAGIIDSLDVPTENIDFSGFNFDVLKSPIDIIDFIEKVNALRESPAGTRFMQPGV